MKELYHGSQEKGITKLEPHKSTHGNYVYATPYKELAIIFSGRCGDDCTFTIYRNNEKEPWQLVERIPEAFPTMFNNSSSIYTVDATNFKDIHTGFAEVVSEVAVNINKEEQLANVYDAIKKLATEGKVQLYIYPNRPPYIPQDSSDLIDKQIKQEQRDNIPTTKQSFERIVLLHPYLIEKVNTKMAELNLKEEPYQKEDLITLFRKAVIGQAIEPNRERYLKSIVLSLSNTYPELIPSIKEELSFLEKTKEEKISFLIDEVVGKMNDIPTELIQQTKEKYLNDSRTLKEIGRELIALSKKIMFDNRYINTPITPRHTK